MLHQHVCLCGRVRPRNETYVLVFWKHSRTQSILCHPRSGSAEVRSFAYSLDLLFQHLACAPRTIGCSPNLNECFPPFHSSSWCHKYISDCLCWQCSLAVSPHHTCLVYLAHTVSLICDDTWQLFELRTFMATSAIWSSCTSWTMSQATS